MAVEATAGEDRWGDGRMHVLNEERHALAVELHVVERRAAVGGNVGIVLEEREGHLGDIAAAHSDRVQDVGPVPAVQGRAGDQRLQAVPEGQRCHHERDGEARIRAAAERTGTALRPSPGSRAMRTPTTPGAESPARRRERHRPCPRCRPDSGPSRHPVRRRRIGQQSGDGTQQDEKDRGRRGRAPPSPTRSRWTGTPGAPGRSARRATAQRRSPPPATSRRGWRPRSDETVEHGVRRERRPRARRIRRSPLSRRNRRAINCAAIRRAATSATMPKTPKAMEIGFNERSALATTGARA